MGVVYKAEDTKLHRPVAVKFLPLGRSVVKNQTDRFIREAQAAASLSHPNIATVFELNEVEDLSTHTTQAFIAMEYVDGKTLEEFIHQGLIPFDVVRDIAVQVARGLASAHEHGIIHRDIKPSNIIITNDGVAKLLDFGLAKLVQETTISEPNKIAGSLAYMSPEQIRGEKLDVRSDIWSFGVLLFQMLSGKIPFRGEHGPAMMYSISNEPAPDIAALREGVPDDLALLCRECLEKDREKRPQSMRELLGILGTQPLSHDVSLRSQIRPLTLRRIAFPGSVAVVIFALLWFGFPSLFFDQSAKQTWRVGILPFRNLTQKAGADNWPILIQMVMVDHFNGVEELRVVDPFSLNGLMAQSAGISFPVEPVRTKLMKDADVELLIDGTIQTTDSVYTIYCTLSQVVSGEVKLTLNTSFVNEEDLTRAVQGVSEQILDFFQIQILSSGRKDDLKPWLTRRTKNLGAVKAFLQGFQLAWRMRPGAGKYYRIALSLDSTFIAPRTWLIAGLANQGQLAEARAHYEVLKRLEPSEGPFEQALIRWSKACIDGERSAQEKALEEVLEYSPRNNVLLYLLGSIKYLQEDFQGSIDVIQPAIDMKWPFQPAAHLLAISHLRLQHYATCRDILERSLSLENVIPETYSLLAALSHRDHNFKKSEEYAEELLRRMKIEGISRDSALALLANDHGFVGEYAKAINYFEMAIQLNPHNAFYHQDLGLNYFKVNNNVLAVCELEISLEIDSTLIESHRLLGEVLEATGNPTAALQQYRIFLRGDSTSSKADEVKRRIGDLMHQ